MFYTAETNVCYCYRTLCKMYTSHFLDEVIATSEAMLSRTYKHLGDICRNLSNTLIKAMFTFSGLKL